MPRNDQESGVANNRNEVRELDGCNSVTIGAAFGTSVGGMLSLVVNLSWHAARSDSQCLNGWPLVVPAIVGVGLAGMSASGCTNANLGILSTGLSILGTALVNSAMSCIPDIPFWVAPAALTSLAVPCAVVPVVRSLSNNRFSFWRSAPQEAPTYLELTPLLPQSNTLSIG